MDAARRAKFEQRAIVVLVLVFGLALFNTLKRLGAIGGKDQAASRAPGAFATATKQLEDSQQTLQERTQPGELPAVPPHGDAMEGLRDPLISMLRKEPLTEPSPSAASAGARTTGPSSAPRMPRVTVQGIILGNRPQAIIDRTLYGVGDMVQGAKIVGISREGVILEAQGMRVVARPAAPSGYPPTAGGRGDADAVGGGAAPATQPNRTGGAP